MPSGIYPRARSATRPCVLFDWLRTQHSFESDASIARATGFNPPHICKMRKGDQPITAEFILALHDIFGYEIKALLLLAGDQYGDYHRVEEVKGPRYRYITKEKQHV